MKKKISLFLSLLIIVAGVFMVIACDLPRENDETDPKSELKLSSIRYEIVPDQANETQPNIVYSATDTESNFYVISLGNVNQVPITSSTAYAYNGTTPINLSFSRSTVTTTSVQHSIATCVSQSSSLSSTIGATMEVSSSIEASVPFAKASTTVKAGISSSISSSLQNSRSTTNTFTTAESEAHTLTESLSFTIGNNGEETGKYRLSLFATVDLFLCIELDVDNNTIISSSTAVCARPDSYTYIVDYDVDINGSFSKTGSGSPISLPSGFYKTLTKPTTIIEKGDVIDVGDNTYAGGVGTESSPYLITTKSQFINMLENCKTTEFYRLENDINLGDWSAYGIINWAANTEMAPSYFTGNLNGNNKTITYKIRIGKTSLISWALGLFPTTRDAVITKLNVVVDLQTYDPLNRNQKWDISNADRAEDVMVGGIVGYAYATNITNCSSSGTIRYNSDGGGGETAVGGIVGYARKCSSIFNCSSSASIYARGCWIAISGVVAIHSESGYGNLSFTGTRKSNEDWAFIGGTWAHDTVAKNQKIL